MGAPAGDLNAKLIDLPNYRRYLPEESLDLHVNYYKLAHMEVLSLVVNQSSNRMADAPAMYWPSPSRRHLRTLCICLVVGCPASVSWMMELLTLRIQICPRSLLPHVTDVEKWSIYYGIQYLMSAI